MSEALHRVTVEELVLSGVEEDSIFGLELSIHQFESEVEVLEEYEGRLVPPYPELEFLCFY